MLFKSGERLLGTERAGALAALGLVPAVAPWALDFLQLWRSRRATCPYVPRNYGTNRPGSICCYTSSRVCV
jgi:hypothetical protein